MTNETRGFYKTIDNHVFYAEKNVHNKEYNLSIDEYNLYEYPVDGWYYFESEEEAYSFFGLEIPIVYKELEEQQYNNIT